MAKLPPERRAAALRANLKRRKLPSPGEMPPGSTKAPEKLKENPSATAVAARRDTPTG
jgi:hypothetical protein